MTVLPCGDLKIVRWGLRNGGGKTCMKKCCARPCTCAAKLAGSDPRSVGSLPAKTGSWSPPTNKARNWLQIQLHAQQGGVKETVKTCVNVISSGRYAPRAVEPGVLIEVQGVLGKQKRGEVYVLSAVVVVELLTDFGVPDLVLSPAVVERLEGLSSEYLVRLGYEVEVGEADVRILLSVFEFAELEVPNELPDSVRRSGPHALREFGFGGREIALLGVSVDEIEPLQVSKESAVPL